MVKVILITVGKGVSDHLTIVVEHKNANKVIRDAQAVLEKLGK